MKKSNKLTLKERNRLIHNQNIGKCRRKKTKTEKKLSTNNTYNYKNRKVIPNIDLPEIFDLHKNTDETLEIMKQFRAVVDSNRPRLKKLNFDKMQYINSSSALMLAAEIDVWNSKTSQKLQAQHSTWNNEVKVLLCEMGFFELLALPPLSDQQKIDKDTTFLKFISGQKVKGKNAKQLRINIEEVIGKELEDRIHLYSGLSEAITNTKQHAYDETNPKSFDKWWITAAHKRNNNKLVVSMYDRGKSIPKTLHKYKKWNEVKSYLSRDLIKNDSHLIDTAMKVSFGHQSETRTRTQEQHRGKGLEQLLSFIKDNGELTIISGKGLCVFTVKNEKLTNKKKKSLKYFLQGTLIEWKINLS